MESKFFDFLQFEITKDQKVIMEDNYFMIEETAAEAKLKKIKLVIPSKYDILCIKLDNLEKQIALLKNKIPIVDYLLIVKKENKLMYIYIELKSRTIESKSIENKKEFSSHYLKYIKEIFLKKEKVRLNTKLEIKERYLVIKYSKNILIHNRQKLFTGKKNYEQISLSDNVNFSINELIKE